jgi:hypothetical protein
MDETEKNGLNTYLEQIVCGLVAPISYNIQMKLQGFLQIWLILVKMVKMIWEYGKISLYIYIIFEKRTFHSFLFFHKLN